MFIFVLFASHFKYNRTRARCWDSNLGPQDGKLFIDNFVFLSRFCFFCFQKATAKWKIPSYHLHFSSRRGTQFSLEMESSAKQGSQWNITWTASKWFQEQASTVVQLILVKPYVKAFCHLPSIKTVKNRRQRVFENLFVREWYKTWTASTLVSTILLSDVKRYLNVKLILTPSHLKNVQSKKCSSKKCPSKKRRGLTGLCYSCLVRDHICVTISIAWL